MENVFETKESKPVHTEEHVVLCYLVTSYCKTLHNTVSLSQGAFWQDLEYVWLNNPALVSVNRRHKLLIKASNKSILQ